MKKNTQIEDGNARKETRNILDGIVQEGARRLLQHAVEIEVADYIERYTDEKDKNRHRKVVRNGWTKERKVLT